MSAGDELWRTPGSGQPPASGRPQVPLGPTPVPYGGYYLNPPGGFPPAPVPPPAEPPLNLAGEALTGLVALVGCLFLGAPMGFLWAAFRPHFNIVAVSAAEESTLKPQFTADMTLAGIGLAAGALLGILAWLLVRRHGSGAAVGLGLGGYGAMRVAAQVGKLAAHPDHLRAVVESQLPPGEMLTGTTAQINEFLDLLSFHLRSGGVLYSFSVAALLLFGALTVLRDRSSPQPAAQQLSSGSAAGESAPVPAQLSAR